MFNKWQYTEGTNLTRIMFPAKKIYSVRNLPIHLYYFHYCSFEFICQEKACSSTKVRKILSLIINRILANNPIHEKEQFCIQSDFQTKIMWPLKRDWKTANNSYTFYWKVIRNTYGNIIFGSRNNSIQITLQS